MLDAAHRRYADLDEAGLDVAGTLWMIEEDLGGVGEASDSLVESFREAFLEQAAKLGELGFPRECASLEASCRAVIPFDREIRSAVESFWNDEDVNEPEELCLRPEGQGLRVRSGETATNFVVKVAGVYTLHFGFSWVRDTPVLEP